MCERVCLWTSVSDWGPPRSLPWQPEQGVLSLLCHSAQVRGVTWKKRGTVGGQKGVGEHCSVWTSGGKRTPEGWNSSPRVPYIRQSWIMRKRVCWVQIQTPASTVNMTLGTMNGAENCLYRKLLLHRRWHLNRKPPTHTKNREMYIVTFTSAQTLHWV